MSQSSHTHTQPGTHDEAALADLLDLDAEVFGSYVDGALDLVERHISEAPHTAIDVGAGTGTGSLALARRFAEAEIVAIDSSEFMLDRLAAAAKTQGLAGRVRTVQADLDATWPDVGPVDLVWAASSLHHIADPDRMLRSVHGALNPGGLLVVIELNSLPRFLPNDIGQGRPGLESRFHEAMAAANWNDHPDWRSNLEEAGFDIADQRSILTALERPTTPAAERCARTSLSRVRAALADRLDRHDVALLGRLLADHGADSPLGQNALRPRSARTVWVARRPEFPHGGTQ